MKIFLFPISMLLAVAACTQKENIIQGKASYRDTMFKQDTIYISNQNNWQEGFGLTNDPQIDSIWGKPVQYYIDNPKCSPVAIDFYQGEFRPSDNRTTAALLQLVSTDDKKLRPLYRWCLNKTIQIQDGALAEYTGEPARRYAEKFPQEFFDYMDYDTTGDKYSDWVNSILYSGYYPHDDIKESGSIRKRMITIMKRNCKNCNDIILKRIEKLALDCFP